MGDKNNTRKSIGSRLEKRQDETREKLKKEGAQLSFSRVPLKWFVKGDKDKNYFLCENAVKNVSLETADNALLAMKNWRGKENLKNTKAPLNLQ